MRQISQEKLLRRSSAGPASGNIYRDNARIFLPGLSRRSTDAGGKCACAIALALNSRRNFNGAGRL